MAKELPYFKFEPSEWENGNIQMLSREDKGLFIDLCCIYWSRLGDLPEKLVIQKLCGGNTTVLQSLYDEKIIELIDSKICINFLDEQLQEFNKISEVNKNNVKKRWAKAKENKGVDTVVLPSNYESDTIREDKIREDNIKIEKNGIESQKGKVKDYFNQTNFDNTMRVFETNRESLKTSLNDFLEIESLQPNFLTRNESDILKHFRNWLKYNPPKKNSVKDSSTPPWILETR